MVNWTTDAIPTEYRGRNFHSRLEANWAAFFDLCAWKYEYEPLDLNGWFPDFALYGEEGNMILVEVKPVFEFPDDVAQRMMTAVKGTTYEACEMLILGRGPFESDVWSDGCAIGWLMENPSFSFRSDPELSEPSLGYWEEATFGKWRSSKKPGFCHGYGSYEDRISCTQDGGSVGYDEVDAESIWAVAASTIQ